MSNLDPETKPEGEITDEQASDVSGGCCDGRHMSEVTP